MPKKMLPAQNWQPWEPLGARSCQWAYKVIMLWAVLTLGMGPGLSPHLHPKAAMWVKMAPTRPLLLMLWFQEPAN